MVIEEKDFRLIPCNDSTLFDLELLYVINKGKSNERTEFKNAGYGFSLESAIKKIAMKRIEGKHETETISLKQFLKEFKDVVGEIKKLCE